MEGYEVFGLTYFVYPHNAATFLQDVITSYLSLVDNIDHQKISSMYLGDHFLIYTF